MELEFNKNEGVISIKINDQEFTTRDYTLMIKEIKDKNTIVARYGEEITEEEKKTIDSMLTQINKISEAEKIEADKPREEFEI